MQSIRFYSHLPWRLSWMVAFCGSVLLLGVPRQGRGADITRSIPQPLPSHPGNIFISGEHVTVNVTPGASDKWRVVDYDGRVVSKGVLKGDKAEVGPLPVGWYKVVRGDAGYITNRVFVGVVESLKAPTPKTSPICMDVAMAWFYPQEERMREVASICQLAGMNWLRDRMLWVELEPERGKFVPATRYDVSAKVQTELGFPVLQVVHHSTPWANPKASRFPNDLRDFYNFWREMARRWNGTVRAVEPWNEADIPLFGGHTGSEMASLQKAAYLGLKAGNPDIIACQNVFAIRRASTLADFNANETWPYFDTYNIHHYEKLENYSSLYADHRAISAGKPIWVTECSVRVKWKIDGEEKELSEENLRLQSERVLKTYALGIHEGAQTVFYFVLPPHVEGKVQFGLVRRDLTPRPGYVAAAAAGRFLADAKPLGQVKTSDTSIHGFLFDTKADGRKTDMLVIWSTNNTTFVLKKTPVACFDHLGRKKLVEGRTLKLESAPLYVVLAPDSRPELVSPPARAKPLPGEPGSLVLQVLLPEEDTVLEESAYKMEPGTSKNISVFLYNFGEKKVSGRLAVSVPSKWKATFPERVEIAPGERKELTLDLSSAGEGWEEGKVRITGNFGRAGKPLVAFRMISAATIK